MEAVGDAPPWEERGGDPTGVAASMAALARRRLVVAFTTTTALALVAGAWAIYALRGDDAATARQGGGAPRAIAPEPPQVAAAGATLAPAAVAASGNPGTVAAPGPAGALEPPAAPVKPIADPALGRLDFAVSPWGEVYVDGTLRGVVPPMTDLELPPGRYQVEIRNSAAAPYRVSVEVKAGEPQRVRHKFP
jgi:hypothetical protein